MLILLLALMLVKAFVPIMIRMSKALLVCVLGWL
jgi:hypothetical protein